MKQRIIKQSKMRRRTPEFNETKHKINLKQLLTLSITLLVCFNLTCFFLYFSNNRNQKSHLFLHKRLLYNSLFQIQDDIKKWMFQQESLRQALNKYKYFDDGQLVNQKYQINSAGQKGKSLLLQINQALLFVQHKKNTNIMETLLRMQRQSTEIIKLAYSILQKAQHLQIQQISKQSKQHPAGRNTYQQFLSNENNYQFQNNQIDAIITSLTQTKNQLMEMKQILISLEGNSQITISERNILKNMEKKCLSLTQKLTTQESMLEWIKESKKKKKKIQENIMKELIQTNQILQKVRTKLKKAQRSRQIRLKKAAIQIVQLKKVSKVQIEQYIQQGKRLYLDLQNFIRWFQQKSQRLSISQNIKSLQIKELSIYKFTSKLKLYQQYLLKKQKGQTKLLYQIKFWLQKIEMLLQKCKILLQTGYQFIQKSEFQQKNLQIDKTSQWRWHNQEFETYALQLPKSQINVFPRSKKTFQQKNQILPTTFQLEQSIAIIKDSIIFEKNKINNLIEKIANLEKQQIDIQQNFKIWQRMQIFLQSELDQIQSIKNFINNLNNTINFIQTKNLNKFKSQISTCLNFLKIIQKDKLNKIFLKVSTKLNYFTFSSQQKKIFNSLNAQKIFLKFDYNHLTQKQQQLLSLRLNKILLQKQQSIVKINIIQKNILPFVSFIAQKQIKKMILTFEAWKKQIQIIQNIYRKISKSKEISKLTQQNQKILVQILIMNSLLYQKNKKNQTLQDLQLANQIKYNQNLFQQIQKKCKQIIPQLRYVYHIQSIRQKIVKIKPLSQRSTQKITKYLSLFHQMTIQLNIFLSNNERKDKQKELQALIKKTNSLSNLLREIIGNNKIESITNQQIFNQKILRENNKYLQKLTNYYIQLKNNIGILIYKVPQRDQINILQTQLKNLNKKIQSFISQLQQTLKSINFQIYKFEQTLSQSNRLSIRIKQLFYQINYIMSRITSQKELENTKQPVLQNLIDYYQKNFEPVIQKIYDFPLGLRISSKLIKKMDQVIFQLEQIKNRLQKLKIQMFSRPHSQQNGKMLIEFSKKIDSVINRCESYQDQQLTKFEIKQKMFNLNQKKIRKLLRSFKIKIEQIKEDQFSQKKPDAQDKVKYIKNKITKLQNQIMVFLKNIQGQKNIFYMQQLKVKLQFDKEAAFNINKECISFKQIESISPKQTLNRIQKQKQQLKNAIMQLKQVLIIIKDNFLSTKLNQQKLQAFKKQLNLQHYKKKQVQKQIFQFLLKIQALKDISTKNTLFQSFYQLQKQCNNLQKQYFYLDESIKQKFNEIQKQREMKQFLQRSKRTKKIQKDKLVYDQKRKLQKQQQQKIKKQSKQAKKQIIHSYQFPKRKSKSLFNRRKAQQDQDEEEITLLSKNQVNQNLSNQQQIEFEFIPRRHF